jgi:peptide/nickel transport system permease protein
MIRFVTRHVLYAFSVLLGVATIVFGLLQISGDPIAALAPPNASPADRALLRERYGLDEPILRQYVMYLGNALTGDLGDSWRQERPALDVVLERLPRTLAMLGIALLIASVVGGTLGVFAGQHPGGVIDLVATAVAMLGQAIPGFWLGTVLILLFAVQWKIFPASGLDGPSSLVLPALTLAAYPTAMVTRLLRGSLIEVLHHDYIRTAQGKGLSEREIVQRHALRNAALPTLAFLGLQAGFLVGGAVVVEAVFGYPGIGSLAYNAAIDRDFPLIQASVIVIATLILVVNLIVEVIAQWLDPRLRAVMAGQPSTSAFGSA